MRNGQRALRTCQKSLPRIHKQDINKHLQRGMSFNNQGKIIWMESFQVIEMFVEQFLNITNGVCGCPGGNIKQYKADDIDLQWHPDTQSITLSGKLKDKISEKLHSM